MADRAETQTESLFDAEELAAAASDAGARIQALRREIEHHTYRYYALDAPDDLRRRVRLAHARAARARGGATPSCYDPASAPPSASAATWASSSPRSRHEQRMYSLDNAMDLDELDAWLDRTKEALRSRGAAWCCELKIDGSLHRAHLRGRRARARRHPRRRHHGRGRDGEHAHRARRAAAPARRGARRHRPTRRRPSSCAARSTCPKASFEALNAAAEDNGRAALRQPAQRRGGQPAPERPDGHGRAATSPRSSTPWPTSARLRRRGQWELLAWLREAGFHVNPDVKRCETRGARCTSSASGRSRSAAVLALRDRRRGGEGGLLRPAG